MFKNSVVLSLDVKLFLKFLVGLFCDLNPLSFTWRPKIFSQQTFETTYIFYKCQDAIETITAFFS